MAALPAPLAPKGRVGPAGNEPWSATSQACLPPGSIAWTTTAGRKMQPGRPRDLVAEGEASDGGRGPLDFLGAEPVADVRLERRGARRQVGEDRVARRSQHVRRQSWSSPRSEDRPRRASRARTHRVRWRAESPSRAAPIRRSLRSARCPTRPPTGRGLPTLLVEKHRHTKPELGTRPEPEAPHDVKAELTLERSCVDGPRARDSAGRRSRTRRASTPRPPGSTARATTRAPARGWREDPRWEPRSGHRPKGASPPSRAGKPSPRRRHPRRRFDRAGRAHLPGRVGPSPDVFSWSRSQARPAAAQPRASPPAARASA